MSQTRLLRNACNAVTKLVELLARSASIEYDRIAKSIEAPLNATTLCAVWIIKLRDTVAVLVVLVGLSIDPASLSSIRSVVLEVLVLILVIRIEGIIAKTSCY